ICSGVISRASACLALLLSLIYSSVGNAHESRPGYLEMREVSQGRYEVHWKQPAVGELVLRINPVFPDSCTLSSADRRMLSGAMSTRMILTCRDGLAGKSIQFTGLEDTITSVLVRIHHIDGTDETRLV